MLTDKPPALSGGEGGSVVRVTCTIDTSTDKPPALSGGEGLRTETPHALPLPNRQASRPFGRGRYVVAVSWASTLHKTDKPPALSGGEGGRELDPAEDPHLPGVNYSSPPTTIRLPHLGVVSTTAFSRQSMTER